jgi:hypothetical protein
MTWTPKGRRWIVEKARQSPPGTVQAADSGGHGVEVDLEKEPSEGEVFIYTIGGGGFVVKGTMLEAAQRLAVEEWPSFELAESGDKIILRSSQVVALRGGTSRRAKGTIGFTARH